MRNTLSKTKTIKVLVIGDPCDGIKTRLISNFIGSQGITTIGIEFKTKTQIVDGQLLRFQIWDTTGQERYRVITNGYCRNTDSILLLYDTNNRDSFENIGKWKKYIDTVSPTGIPVYLVAGRYDSNSTTVSREEGQHLADELRVPFFVCSEESNGNINAPFESIAREVFMKSYSEIRKNSRMLAQGKREKNSIFSTVPDELLIKIAAHTGNSKHHEQKEAEDIAYANFGKPPRT